MRLPKIEYRTDTLEQHLKNGIDTAKGINGDYMYITVGDAKILLRMISELKDLKKRTEDDLK